MMLLWALLLGAASAFAFQPVGLWPLMPLSFALLAELVSRQPRLRGALGVGWAYGVGQFCVGLNWIATAFTFQAAMPAWLGWVAVVLLSLYLAVYPMLSAGLAWRFGKDRRLALVLALAGSWALTEWLRATMFTGFSWNPVGAALVDTSWRGVTTWIGTYGLSLLTVLMGAALWLLWRRHWRAGGAIAMVSALLAVPVLYPHGGDAGTVAIRVVQPNIGQEDKWTENFDVVAAERLDALSRKPRGDGPLLLFWPEAAVTDPLIDPRPLASNAVLYERLRATRAMRPGDTLLTGGLGLTSADGQTVTGATNSVMVMDKLGRIGAKYDKAHLVPYGEYLPMRPLLSAIGLSRLAPGDLDFAAGPGPRTATLPDGVKVGFQLCYEIIFSGEVVDRSDRPDVIFNPSNDAWFGRWGPPQHLAQARLRATEEGIGVVRATPTGISAIVAPDGSLVKSLPWKTAGIIDGSLQPPYPPTPFAMLGNLIPILIGLILLGSAIALGRRPR